MPTPYLEGISIGEFVCMALCFLPSFSFPNFIIIDFSFSSQSQKTWCPFLDVEITFPYTYFTQKRVLSVSVS